MGERCPAVPYLWLEPGAVLSSSKPRRRVLYVHQQNIFSSIVELKVNWLAHHCSNLSCAYMLQAVSHLHTKLILETLHKDLHNIYLYDSVDETVLGLNTLLKCKADLPGSSMLLADFSAFPRKISLPPISASSGTIKNLECGLICSWRGIETVQKRASRRPCVLQSPKQTRYVCNCDQQEI